MARRSTVPIVDQNLPFGHITDQRLRILLGEFGLSTSDSDDTTPYCAIEFLSWLRWTNDPYCERKGVSR